MMSKKQESKDEQERRPLSARAGLLHGLRGRCPRCGQGRIFKSYLKQVEHCPSCQEDIGNLRADDGPAWLTILIIGHIVAPFIAFFALNETLPQWLLIGVLFFLVTVLVFLLLPRAKGLFIAAIWLIKSN